MLCRKKKKDKQRNKLNQYATHPSSHPSSHPQPTERHAFIEHLPHRGGHARPLGLLKGRVYGAETKMRSQEKEFMYIHVLEDPKQHC